VSLAYFIARRIHFSREADASQRVSPPAIRIAIAGIAIGLAVMILSVAIVVGFKQEVRRKVIDFGAHMQVQALTANTTYETTPIAVSDTLMALLRSVPGVRSVQPFATKPALIKTADDFLAVAVKGITADRGEEDFFTTYLREGSPLFAPADDEEGEADADPDDAADEVEAAPLSTVLLSRTIADRLHLSVGQTVWLYFVRTEAGNEFAWGSAAASVKSRRVTVSGIYESHFDEYDRQIIAADLRLLQQVGEWHPDEVSGLEIRVDDFDRLDDTYLRTAEVLEDYADSHGEMYYLRTVQQMNPQIFGWLDLLDTNVWVILILIASVAAFTMISGLLIIILERTRMIGILKALGYDNGGLRRVFLYMALFLTGKGLIWGNVVGLLLCYVQSRWHLIRLDPENYYLEWVPIALQPWHVAGINVATVVLTLLVLIAPSSIIAKISPTKAIQAD
jgi:lipoprotein-releasing system permease protein